MAEFTNLRPKPQPNQPWVDGDGTPHEAFSTFMLTAERLLKMINGAGGMTLINAANDAAAAAGGVAIGALYRNGSVVMIRVV